VSGKGMALKFRFVSGFITYNSSNPLSLAGLSLKNLGTASVGGFFNLKSSNPHSLSASRMHFWIL
jgi:hypothetical protein